MNLINSFHVRRNGISAMRSISIIFEVLNINNESLITACCGKINVREVF